MGDVGVALSTLRPIGKGEFENEVLEVRSLGELVPTDSKIRVIKVNKREIFVEPIK